MARSAGVAGGEVTRSSLLEGVMGGRRRGVGGREPGEDGWLLHLPLMVVSAFTPPRKSCVC